MFYNISYKSLIDSKPLRTWCDKIIRFIGVYDRTSHLVLYGSEKYDPIYNRIRYLRCVKSGITSKISHNYARIKVDSFDFLSLEKSMTFHNVIILIKSVWNKDKNSYYYNIFLEKASN